MGWKDAPVVEEKQPAWATAPVVEAPAPTAAPQAYKPFATVRKDIDPASLNTDQDWLNASRMMYQMWERKPFEGTDAQLAEWGKDSMGNFNFNLVSMAQIANAVTKATQEEKEAFLWMMDTYDNTNMSWEGAGRAVKGIVTDPTTYVGIGTLGAGFVVRQGGKEATKFGLRQSLMQSLGRTGITAGIEGGVYAGTQSTIEQGVEVSAGRRDGISFAKTLTDTAVGAVGGVVLGTAADAAVTKIISTIRGPKAPEVTPNAPAVSPSTPQVQAVDASLPNIKVTESTLKNPDGTPLVLYHGTKSAEPFDNFDLNKASSNTGNDGYWGKGVNLTQDRDAAGNYSLFDNAGNEVQGGRIVSTVADLQNPFEVINDGALADRLLALQGWTDAEQAIIRKEGGWLTGQIPGSRITEVMQSNGYDGVIVRGNKFVPDGKGGTVPQDIINEVVVFDPAKVRIVDQGTKKPLGSTLTRSEIDEATARKQVGRLPEDDVLPVALGDTSVNVTVPARNTGLRTTAQNMQELTGLGEQVAVQLRPLKDADLEVALEKLRTAELPFEEMRVAARGVQMYADELRIQRAEVLKELNKANDPQKVAELTQRSYEIENRLAALERADDAFGSMAGSLLRQRQEGLPGVEGLTIEKIMEEQKLPRAEAEKVYAEQVLAAAKQAEVKKIEAEYAPKIDAALDRGDFAEATRLAQEKSRTVNAITGEMVPESASWMRKATEWAISNVFTVKTLFVNIIPSGVKTVMIPALKAIVKNPLERATRVEMAATYSAMRATFKSALKASAEAYKYETAFLTRDSNRILETGLAIKGKFGGAVRLFPRLLNSTDEFLSQINYAAYVAGRAAAEAFADGTEKGLKGKALDDFVEKAVEKARKASFEGNTGDDLINPIIAKGLNLGYTGDDLFRYVEKEMAGNGTLLKALGYGEKDLSVLQRGTDEEALNFVRDVLYKKDFSGKGNASKAARFGDKVFREWPSLKLITGQLFFRTPVRVFEEGVRLTPGLNILAPNFIKDLTGANGTLRQVRAQGEALASLGMTGMILSLYGQGRITGDGAYENYHQQKLRGDGPKQEPYTIKMADGSTWSYRNFDPIATPMKIIVNALERYDKLRIREAQGEFIDASEFKKPIALITVATGAMSRAFIDAGLTEGINQLSKLAEIAADPAKEDSTTLKYIGEKLNLIVPNTIRKIARENDPTIKDPVTFWQMVEQRVLGPVQGAAGADPKLTTSYAYDALGMSVGLLILV